MKSKSIIAITTALALSGGAFARAQDALLLPPEPAALPAVEEAVARIQAQVDQQAEAAQRQGLESVARVERAIQLAQAAVKPLSATTAPGAPAGNYATRLDQIVRRGKGASKTLVVRSSETDSKTVGNLEEDLAVMSRIFDKALAQQLDEDHRPRAMGIDVFFAPGSSPVRSLYLEGYGALFMLNANFPLLPPPEKPEEAKEKPETDSTWEEAKKELYGRQPGVGEIVDLALSGRYDGPSGSEPEYDEGKVNQLKDALLNALKNGTNIRNLKADDAITVCVFGRAGAHSARAKYIKKRNPEPGTIPQELEVYNDFVKQSDGARVSIMTLRVKKSDVDAFAKNNLDLDAFRKKVVITTYAGNSGGWGNGNGFSFGGGGFGGGGVSFSGDAGR